MNILFICMNPLNSNSSGNLRNIGFITGAIENKNCIDMVTLEDDATGINYDSSYADIIPEITKIYTIKQNYIYKKLRSRKRPFAMENGSSHNPKKAVFKNIIKKVVKSIFIYDFQRINIKNVHLDKQYDLVLSSSDPKSSHLLAEYIIKKNRVSCPWYQYWGDPMRDDITLSAGAFKGLLIKKSEEHLLKKADKVIYTSPLTLERQKELYPLHSYKMIYVAQACLKQEKEIHLQRGSLLKVGYFGDYHSKIRNLKPLCSAIKHMPDCRLILAGRGDIQKGHPNIEVLPRMSYSQIMELENEMDILIGVCNRTGTQIPAKFYYMSGTQKPIILIADGEHSEYLRKYFQSFNRFIVCMNRTDEIIQSIQTAARDIEIKRHYTIPDELLPKNIADIILEKRKENDG